MFHGSSHKGGEMKKLFVVPVLAAFVAMAGPSVASAQVMVGLAGGVTLPQSDYGDYANTGWLGHLDVGVPVGESGLAVGASGFYGSNGHDEEIDTGKTNLYGGAGVLSYNIRTSGPVTPAVFGLAGIMRHQYKNDDAPELEGTESGFMWGGGVGLGFPLGGVGGVIEAWYVSANIGDSPNDETTAIFGIDFGIQIMTGGGM